MLVTLDGEGPLTRRLYRGLRRAILEGRFNVAYSDVQAVAAPALRHRIILNFEGEAEQVNPDTLVQELLRSTPAD